MIASAPAKIILFGEHAVVHGQPAIAVPVSSLRAEATVQPGGNGLHIHVADLDEVLPVEIDSDLVDNALILTARRTLKTLAASPPDATISLRSTIPMASGLGSGAAVSTAIARAVAAAVDADLSQETLNNLIYDIEKLYHGTPSGIDNTVIVYEKPVFFVREHPIETLTIGKPFTLVIGDTGQSALTRIAVGDVNTLVRENATRIQPVLDEIGAISRKARRAIETGDIATLGPLMNRNHHLLRDLTVSSPELETLTQAARDAGALGAKLSGGGRGGNMIALVDEASTDAVRTALIKAGAVRVFVSDVGR